MKAIASSGMAEIAAICDVSSAALEAIAASVPQALRANDWHELLCLDLDGVVIATPSAQHAEQSMEALRKGLAVFCQKPLGRSASETKAVVAAARRANRLLGVDLSYRCLAATEAIRKLVAEGELGRIFAVELVFHNAYGPDKPWFYQRELSGGGCVIDLGIHLVDLALWILGGPKVQKVLSKLFAKGAPLKKGQDLVEDYGAARLDLDNGTLVQLSCSWNLPAGCEAIIQGKFYGTRGGAAFHNVNGSFYDFRAERFCRTATETLVEPPDSWGGRAALRWVEQLARNRAYHPEIESIIEVSKTIDAIYLQHTS
jgi:predicted dehydrogenase